jgi:hypothetical protein
LVTSAVSRSADSSTVSNSSARSRPDSVSSGSRRLPAAALIEVSGVRRSCPTGRQQRRAQPVALRLATGFDGLGGHPLVAQGEQRLPADRLQHPPVVGGQRPAPGNQVDAVVDLHDDIRVLRPWAVRGPGARDVAPAARAVGGPLQYRDGVQAERLGDLLQQPGQRLGPGQHGPGEGGEQGRLGAGVGGLRGTAGGPVHHQRDRHRDDHHHDERDHVLPLGDGQRVQRRGQKEVQQQPAGQRGEQRRPEPADQGHHDRGQEEQHHIGRQAHNAPGEHAAEGRRARGEDRQRPAEDPAVQRQRAAHQGHPPATAGLAVGDHVHVDGAGLLDDRGADPLVEQPRQAGARRRPEHQLGGVGAEREVEQRRRHVVAVGHGVERGTDVVRQPAQRADRGRWRPGQAVAA